MALPAGGAWDRATLWGTPEAERSVQHHLTGRRGTFRHRITSFRGERLRTPILFYLLRRRRSAYLRLAGGHLRLGSACDVPAQMITRGMADALDPDGSLAKKAVALIEGEKERLALAIVQQVRTVVPRYQDVDPTAQLRNTATVLACVGDLLVYKRTNRLADFVESVVQLRAAIGFSVGDFLVGGLCFLPVLRRFLVHRAASTAEGLVMYELIEQMALPFNGRVAEIYAECSGDVTDPDGVDTSRFLSLLSDSLEVTPLFQPVPIASIDDFPSIDEDDGAWLPLA